MRVLIRPVKFGDLKQIITINETNLQENYSKSTWLDFYQNAKNHCFVAECMKNIVGYVFCYECSIVSIAVNEEYRKKHVGTELLKHCLNTFSEKQKSVDLHVRTLNEYAIKLYKSLDFQVTGTELNYYTDPTDDAFVMVWKYKPEREKYVEKKKLNLQ